MDESLQKLFADANLAMHQTCAQRWCKEAKVTDVEELLDSVDDLAKALQLRPLEAKRLTETLQAANGVARSYSAPVSFDAGVLERVLSTVSDLPNLSKTVSVGYTASAAVYRDDLLSRANSLSRTQSSAPGRTVSACSDGQPLARVDTVGGYGASSREALKTQASDKALSPIDEGQTGSVYAVEADGRKLAVFKPNSGEGFERHGIPAGKGALREEAVYVVDRLCEQWAGVPVTSQTSIEVEGRQLDGALQKFHEDATDFAEDVGMPRDFDEAIAKVRQEDAEGLALLDLRVCNTDRHGSNLLFLGPTWPKAMGPIDHGCCLPPWWALGEAVFDAWLGWPQLQCRPSAAARSHALKAKSQLPTVCRELARLGLDPDSILTLQLCTTLVAVGIGSMGLPLASIANRMVREDYSELCWLEQKVLEAARKAGATVSVQPNKRNDKVLIVEHMGALEPEAFARQLVDRLEEVFRAELAQACGEGAIPQEDDDGDESPLTRSGATQSSYGAQLKSLAENTCVDDEEDTVLQRASRW